MPFEKIPNNKLSLFVVNQIEQMILEVYRPGTGCQPNEIWLIDLVFHAPLYETHIDINK